jgi:hypothetical protein
MNPTALPTPSDAALCILHEGAQALAVDPGNAPNVPVARDAEGSQSAGILVMRPIR